VLIVGAVVCAIALGVALWTARHPYTIVERQDEIGRHLVRQPLSRLWRRYPNHSYSFSFGARNPWTRYLAQRQELLDYLLKVVREYDIRKNVRLSTELVASRWDDAGQRWISTLKTGNGEETLSRPRWSAPSASSTTPRLPAQGEPRISEA